MTTNIKEIIARLRNEIEINTSMAGANELASDITAILDYVAELEQQCEDLECEINDFKISTNTISTINWVETMKKPKPKRQFEGFMLFRHDGPVFDTLAKTEKESREFAEEIEGDWKLQLKEGHKIKKVLVIEK